MKREKSIKKENNKLFRQEIGEGIEYLANRKYAVISWIALYLIPALVSLFITDWTVVTADFPLVICNVVPRILSLMLLTLFGYTTKFGKTFFVGGLTVWSVWLSAISNNTSFAIITGLIGVVATALTAWYERKPERQFKPNKAFYEYIGYFYMIVILTLVVEMVHRLSITKPVLMLLQNPDIFMSNVQVLIFTTVFVLISRRRKFAITIALAVWLILPFISLLKILNVYEPLTLLDIFAVVDMSAVVLKYFKWFFFVLVALVLAGLVVLLVYIAKKEKKQHVRGSRLVTVGAIFICLVLSFIGMSKLSYMKFTSNLIIENYYDRGFASSFLRYIAHSAPEKPEETEEISLELIKEKISETYDGKETYTDVKNVVVVQMESFCDPYLFYDGDEKIVYEEDPIPFIHSLMENYTSGNVKVPVFAGQTCKSEFEFLTGVNIDTLPGGFNPYVTSLNGNTQIDSLARYFTENRYRTTAIHNYQGEFFSRYIVYDNLGFDRFIPVECMSDCERRGIDIWAGDSILAEEFEQVLDTNEDGKNFIFTVSMQLHGSYPSLKKSEYTMEITGLEKNDDMKGKLAYYVKELQSFDNAVKSIVEFFEKRDEPTVVLFYADHLPLIARDLRNMTNEETFMTNYFIWDNIGLEKTSEDMELYYLSTALMDKIGATGTFMNKFNRLYSGETEQTIVGYEMTFENNDFTNENYRIGIQDPEIIEITITNPGEARAVYSVRGTGITEDVVVTVNGKTYGIDYKNSKELTFSMGNKKLSEGDVVTLRILGERLSTVFCESKSFKYSEQK